jgi:ferrous iron transport protein B
MRLSDLKVGQEAIVIKILGYGAFRKRLIEMGFVRGKRVKALLSAPMGDPVKYAIMNYEVSLRRTEANLVEVLPVEQMADLPEQMPSPEEMTVDCDYKPQAADFDRQRRTITVALIGNPNCGKTTMFNFVSGAKEHVGNYSGVTVDAKEGRFEYNGYSFKIVDLPGTYSLAAYSPEEVYVRRYLRTETPDVIVNVVVASNLERNLYLTTELIDMDRSMVIALNMYDELRHTGATLDYGMLGSLIGVPVVPTVSRTGEGLHELFDAIIRVYEGRDTTVRHVHVGLGDEIESALHDIKDIIKADRSLAPEFSPRYHAIKFLENDPETEELLRHSPAYEQLCTLRGRGRAAIEQGHGEDVTAAIAARKYGYIDGALAETMTGGNRVSSATRATAIIDAFVTNRLFGIPFFFGVMFLMFWLTFQIGSYPMAWIESGVDALKSWLSGAMSPGPLKDLIIDGAIGGVGSVIVFLPNILILYFCISFMEDSGYMARAAFIMDRAMHKLGIHGKSFIPMVMGFGCNVPAEMATRTIESRSSRLITILINPFMSCSARLPTYVLMVGTFFSAYAALVFLSLYLLGIVVAVFTAKMLRRFVWKKDETPFVMELPPYRVPTLKATVSHTWFKGQQFLRKMGGVILIAGIIVWALNYFPRPAEGSSEPRPDTYLETIGKTISPVMEPIGFHWRATVAVIAGIPAKEVVVSTLGVLYANNEEASDSDLRAQLSGGDNPDFTPASALSFMVFVLLFCPCIATLLAIRRETGSAKFMVFTIVYNTLMAWLCAFAVYHIALIFL